MSASDSFQVGPFPGWLGEMAALHGRYYAENWQFPTSFEAKVAREAAAFVDRYRPGRDLILSQRGDGHALATITLDVTDPAHASGEAHLRWFIVAETLQGQGLGRRLLDGAIGHAKAIGAASIYLTTFRGLDAASAAYARTGFVIVQEQEGRTWGRAVIEQRLECRL